MAQSAQKRLIFVSRAEATGCAGAERMWQLLYPANCGLSDEGISGSILPDDRHHPQRR